MSKSNLVTLIVIIVGTGGVVYMGWPAGPFAAYQIAALAVMAVCFSLLVAARVQLGRSFSASAQARQLVTHGLYSKLRNPIYVFGGGFVAAAFVYLGRPQLLLLFVALVPLQIKRARAEARVLEDAFGDQYRAYKARTWF